MIEREYMFQLDINTVAAQIATSRRQLQRAFAEAGGTSFSAYLIDFRLRRGAALLRGGGMTVRQVAQHVGFRQPSQFAKMFRRKYGAPPSSFKPSKLERAPQA